MTINRESKTYRRMARLLEVLFLALAGLYMLYRISKSTTFHLIWPSWFEPGLMHGLALIALLRLLTGKLKRRETLIALAFALIYGMVYRTDGYSFLPFLGILTVGFIDIGHRKILRMYLLTAGTLFCVTVLAGYLGVITNYVRIKNGLRSAWGLPAAGAVGGGGQAARLGDAADLRGLWRGDVVYRPQQHQHDLPDSAVLCHIVPHV